jgi:hypothetical protein
MIAKIKEKKFFTWTGLWEKYNVFYRCSSDREVNWAYPTGKTMLARLMLDFGRN